MRTPLIAGNWKLNKTSAEARSFIAELQSSLDQTNSVEVLLCPVFTALSASKEAVGNSRILIGAQDIFFKDSGAYTGEVSAPLLKDAGCTHVLIGHSERRGRFGVPEPDLEGDAGSVFGDNDTTVNRKVLYALQNDLLPIICVGETLSERHNGNTDSVVRSQTQAAVAGVEAGRLGGLIFAYEPVWAIGTGETCEASEADRVCGVIRNAVSEIGGAAAAESVRIQYGGSVKADNALDLLSRPHIDGALVGGASLKADSFAAIIDAAASVVSTRH